MNRRQFLQGALSAGVALVVGGNFKPEPKMMRLERRAIAQHEWWASDVKERYPEDAARIQAVQAKVDTQVADFEHYWGQRLGREVRY